MITERRKPQKITREEAIKLLNEIDECESGQDKINWLQRQMDRIRAEAFMDASWWIWESVPGSVKAIEVVKKCRTQIEDMAQSFFYGAKAYCNR